MNQAGNIDIENIWPGEKHVFLRPAALYSRKTETGPVRLRPKTRSLSTSSSMIDLLTWDIGRNVRLAADQGRGDGGGGGALGGRVCWSPLPAGGYKTLQHTARLRARHGMIIGV
jgi:hypothetical protein